ncbi:hypothetical protein [Dermabacter hominis]|uniref:hypothetical protein n=1 Tax=Dermabacter hominis TaxID=36740 RepID=UPI002A437E56|nr:hypothetical protein [Dermabacter hominis]
MTTTDTDDLTERIARALDKNFNPGCYPIMAAMFMDYAAAILPEVEAEVRKAKAETLRAAAHDYWAEHEPTDAEVGHAYAEWMNHSPIIDLDARRINCTCGECGFTPPRLRAPPTPRRPDRRPHRPTRQGEAR